MYYLLILGTFSVFYTCIVSISVFLSLSLPQVTLKMFYKRPLKLHQCSLAIIWLHYSISSLRHTQLQTILCISSCVYTSLCVWNKCVFMFLSEESQSSWWCNETQCRANQICLAPHSCFILEDIWDLCSWVQAFDRTTYFRVRKRSVPPTFRHLMHTFSLTHERSL